MDYNGINNKYVVYVIKGVISLGTALRRKCCIFRAIPVYLYESVPRAQSNLAGFIPKFEPGTLSSVVHFHPWRTYRQGRYWRVNPDS